MAWNFSKDIKLKKLFFEIENCQESFNYQERKKLVWSCRITEKSWSVPYGSQILKINLGVSPDTLWSYRLV